MRAKFSFEVKGKEVIRQQQNFLRKTDLLISLACANKCMRMFALILHCIARNRWDEKLKT